MGYGIYTTAASKAFTSTKYGVDDVSYLNNFSVQEVYRAYDLDPLLDPKNVRRECRDSEDHPNSLPIILGLDVTGSMGPACKMCASKIDEIMTTLYKTNKDVEFCMMGIGDFACDRAPLQVTQFESDVRILDQTTKIYFESGGGGNGWESYTAAWWFALNRCDLDCWKRGEKGIIITMGDEPMNPYLPGSRCRSVFGNDVALEDVETEALYKAVTEKYNVYHIAITNDSSYDYYKERIEESWRPLLGDHLITAESNALPGIIAGIVNSRKTFVTSSNAGVKVTDEGISW